MFTFILSGLFILTMIITLASTSWANDIVFHAIQAGLFVLLIQQGLDWWQVDLSGSSGGKILIGNTLDDSAKHAFFHKIVINQWR